MRFNYIKMSFKFSYNFIDNTVQQNITFFLESE